jgi:hypothetical protein
VLELERAKCSALEGMNEKKKLKKKKKGRKNVLAGASSSSPIMAVFISCTIQESVMVVSRHEGAGTSFQSIRSRKDD